MQLNSKDYKPNELLKFIRQYTNLNQKEFSKSIGKSLDWQRSNEIGRANYYFKDLLTIIEKYNLELIIRSKK